MGLSLPCICVAAKLPCQCTGVCILVADVIMNT